MNDPFPGTSWADALEQLYRQFGNEHVRVPASNGDVFIDMPLANGGQFHAGLTWQQAKYIAFKALRAEDLRDRKFPPDWPEGE